jgi:hypothetical protein
MNAQKIALWIFFPMMYATAFTALLGIWNAGIVHEDFFRLIPTFFIVGLASGITWLVSVICELKNIAKDKK